MGDKLRAITILGSTGSIGVQTLDMMRSLKDQFYIVGLGAGYNSNLIEKQILNFHPQMFSFQIPEISEYLSTKFDIPCVSQEEIVSNADIDLVVAATVGAAGFGPIIAAIDSGKNIALANKEPLVMAGELVMALAYEKGAQILPVDSEPSAIWQCIRGDSKGVSRIIITASGGAFRSKAIEDLHKVTPEEALKHPTWSMGKKITIDSATLMNKAFEVAEAHWLFDIPFDNIDVVVHPQSIIHSMVEFTDGSVKAQMSTPDMRLPIQHALFYPDRNIDNFGVAFDPVSIGSLTFEELDHRNFPCFDLALSAFRQGGSYPIVVNAANEVAVDLFLNEYIRFTDIPRLIGDALSNHVQSYNFKIDEVMDIDKKTRIYSYKWPNT